MHGFPYHLYKVAPQCLQICLVTELRGERFEGLSSIILPPVEATVYERLALPQAPLRMAPPLTRPRARTSRPPTAARYRPSSSISSSTMMTTWRNLQPLQAPLQTLTARALRPLRARLLRMGPLQVTCLRPVVI